MAEMPPKLTVEGKGNAAVARTKLLHSRPLHSTDFSVVYISPFYFYFFSIFRQSPPHYFLIFYRPLDSTDFSVGYFFDTTDFSALFFIFFFFFRPLDFRQNSLLGIFSFFFFLPSLFLPFYFLVLDIV